MHQKEKVIPNVHFDLLNQNVAALRFANRNFIGDIKNQELIYLLFVNKLVSRMLERLRCLYEMFFHQEYVIGAEGRNRKYTDPRLG